MWISASIAFKFVLKSYLKVEDNCIRLYLNIYKRKSVITKFWLSLTKTWKQNRSTLECMVWQVRSITVHMTEELHSLI